MKKIFILSLFVFMHLNAATITIGVAANVSYAMDSLIKEFNKSHPDIKVRAILGGSGKLRVQIKHGAPYQLFMSANMEYPNSLYKEGLTATKPVVYAQGSLACFSGKKQNFSNCIEVLKNEKIEKIAVANPKTAPYGKATFEALKNANVYDEVKGKFIYSESIAQTVSYAVTAADLGFIAKSSLYSPKMSMYKEGENWMEVDSKLYSPISQGIVILKSAEKNAEVLSFYNFILSKKAGKILEEFGYLIP